MKRLFILLLVLAIPVLAALPPQSPEELEEQAQLVLTAQVVDIGSSKKWKGIGSYDNIYTLKLRVVEVKKGSVGGEKAIEVLCKQTGRRPNGWAGPQGQNDIPDVNTFGTFYLRKHGSGSFHLLEPNGWEPQPKPE